jgi:purine-binding chemotaxis protein CheW
MGIQQLVKFQLGDDTFGIGITQIYQILKPQQIFKVPNAPQYIEGLLNLRGKILTVFNLRKRFNMPGTENDESTRIITVKADDYLLGFIVDSVTEIIRVPDEEIENTPPALKNFDKRFLSGVAKVDDKLILLLNFKEILTLDEEQQVKDIIEQNKTEILK